MGTRFRMVATEVTFVCGSLLLAGALMFGIQQLTPGLSSFQSLVFVLGPIVTALATLLYFGFALIFEPNIGPQWRHASWVSSLGAVLLGTAAAVLGSFGLSQLMLLLGAPVEEQDTIMKIIEAGSRWDLFALGFSAVVLAPLAEEALFRGLMFRRLNHSGWPEAYTASAIMFALIHANPSGLIVYIWLGVVFAATYRYTGRLWTAMAVHMGNNAVALAGLLAAPLN